MTRGAKLSVTLFAGDSNAIGTQFHRCQAFTKSSLHARTHAHVSLPEAVSLVALVSPAGARDERHPFEMIGVSPPSITPNPRDSRVSATSRSTPSTASETDTTTTWRQRRRGRLHDDPRLPLFDEGSEPQLPGDDAVDEQPQTEARTKPAAVNVDARRGIEGRGCDLAIHGLALGTEEAPLQAVSHRHETQ
jgi:hypothetical protein